MTETSLPGAADGAVRRTWLAIGAILILAFIALLAWPRAQAERKLAPEVSVAEAAALQEDGAFLLDVREPDEWAEAHIEGSTLIPLGELEKRTDEVPTDKDVVVVCGSGNRSKKGRDILYQSGFEHVTSMAGGLAAWKEAGRPVVSGS